MKRRGRFHATGALRLFILALGHMSYAQYGGGSGTADDPYLIYTPQQLNAIGANPDDWDKHFQLTADIDLSAYTGTEFNLIGLPSNPFVGTFDGDRHTISGFSYVSERRFYAGLFGAVGDPNAEIRSLGLIAPEIDVGTGGYAGALVGDFDCGTLKDCYTVGGTVLGHWQVGGLVGRFGGDRLATITDCHVAGTVDAYDDVGGLAGSNYKGVVENSYSTCAVSGHDYVGGFVGRNAGEVIDCYSTGTVNGRWDTGGLVGINTDGVINSSFATGDVTGYCWAGGLVGEHIGTTIIGCHASGSVVGEDIMGGLVGISRNAVINCHATGDVTGDEFVGGLVGVSSDVVTHSWSGGSVSGNEGIGGLAGVGWNSCVVSNSYSVGPVCGRESVGGLVGDSRAVVVNSYSTGVVTGEDAVGGLVGYQARPGIIADSYSIGVVDGVTDQVGGLVGTLKGRVLASFWDTESSLLTTSDGGTGLTTSQMQDRQTYIDAGWDFVGEEEDGLSEIWQIPADGGYPVLGSFNGYVPSDPCGEGSFDCPYLLRSPADVSLLYHCPEGCFRLISDIDLTEVVWRSPPVPVFCGRLDGEHHRIMNMTIRGDGPFGFFAHVGESGSVQNVRFEAAYVAGGIGPFRGDRVGVLAGFNAGSVFGCYVDGAVRGDEDVGLLAGENRGIISSSCGTGDVYGDERVGGLVGTSSGEISRCFSMASVSGIWRTGGGLVGLNNYGGLISKSYSTGSVDDIGHSFVGGFVGYGYSDDISASFWDIQTSGRDESFGGMGLTTAEMMTAATFLEAGWDFVGETVNGTDDVWWIDEGVDYPRLGWERPEGEF